ncbi:M23 family metallopeptidase [Granulicoccus phenolivorans]|uniref:M23 family metallopeptidase n=1 Tax=Granulicoccus phenolivorans TaxID=266854 RepID=UPI000403B6AE|nr:peptidoglycan DD-metalloendopeptidase family protein [Granulicoccus phenolivorans]
MNATHPLIRSGLLAGLVGLLLGIAAAGPAQAVPTLPSPSVTPLAGNVRVVTEFRPPERRWLAGHRGVDLAGTPGQVVRAAAAGRISFAGTIAGRPVITVDHGEVRTTYEPVDATLPVGAEVAMGEQIGTLRAGHDCAAAACLHWGLKHGEDYLDPMLLATGDATVRMLPGSAPAEARERAAAREAARRAAAEQQASAGTDVPQGPAPPPGSRGLVRPADGPLTSRFGMRVHPVTGVYKLHDGLDFGTGCGAPLRAIAAGRVTDIYYNAGYGNRLMLDHGLVNGRPMRSSYNHAIRYLVGPGATVQAGQVIGLSGSTGYSTGCHLHFMLWVDGQLVNPEAWL